MATLFTYSISGDTLNGAVATAKLTDEVRADAGITIALLSVSESGNDLNIEFKDNLPTAQEPLLDAVVAAHDGNPGINDPAKVQVVNDQSNPAAYVDDAGLRRFPIDLKSDATIVGPQGPQGDPGPQGPAGPSGGLSEFNYAEDESTSSTTSGTYQQKLRLTTGSLVGGNYFIQWHYEGYTSDIDANFRVQVDDTTTISEIEHVSVDEGDKHYWSSFSGIKRINLSAGVHNIDIDYNDDGGGSAQIRRARISLFGVS